MLDFDVDVRVAEPRREDAAAGIEDLGRAVARLLVRAGRLDGGDAAAGDPKLAAVEDALRVGREQPRPGDDEVGRGAARGDVGEAAGHGRKRCDREAGQFFHGLSRAAPPERGPVSMIVRNAGHCPESRDRADARLHPVLVGGRDCFRDEGKGAEMARVLMRGPFRVDYSFINGEEKSHRQRRIRQARYRRASRPSPRGDGEHLPAMKREVSDDQTGREGGVRNPDAGRRLRRSPIAAG